MKTTIKRISLVLTILLPAMSAAAADIFTNFYNFGALSNNTNGDGANPRAGLTSDGARLYGTTTSGGTNGLGTVYAINLDGTSFTNLHNFFGSPPTNGAGPSAGLVLSGGVLFGTTRVGGSNGLGTVFSISTNGEGFGKLHDFGGPITSTDPQSGNHFNSSGAFPETDMVLASNTLYGATEQGGGGAGGTLFKINTDGSGFTVLHEFTNADGGFPSVHMVVSGTNLFGTTQFGGTGPFPGNGTIFRVGTNGFGFTNLYDFNGLNAAMPIAGLVLSGSTLYGTANSGNAGQGGAPYGSLFKIGTDGLNFAIVYVFDPGANGAHPASGLAISGDQIYGTEGGFDTFGGTIFRVNTDGSGYTNLTSFNNPGDPGDLNGLLLQGGNIYCTGQGGANGTGDVFKLILGAQTNQHLNIQLVNQTVVLTWSDTSFSLYSASSINGVFSKISGAASPYTNSIIGAQQFFEVK